MADKAHNETDGILADMEAHLAEIYEQAGEEIEAKADEYFSQFERLDAQKKKQVEEGRISEDEYIRWRKNKILYGKHWTQLKEKIAAEYANVNRIALAYINGRLPKIYALNYNAIGKDIGSAVKGYSFELINADLVKNLATKDDTLLPYKYLDGKKDVRWNTKKVNSAVLQGILQGESIPKMSKRLQSVTGMNKTAAIRNARTCVTGAECKARQDGFERAAADGIELQREWIAAIDGRTRHAHRLLDGHLAGVDEPFKSELGDIMFPGDPEASPENVYNCRCTIAAKVVGFNNTKKSKPDLTDKDGFDIMNMDYGMNRKAGNKDAFSVFPERMSKKHIRSLAKEVGIDLKGITLHMDLNEDLIKIPYTGRADGEKIGLVTFFPNAFASREDLIRTIFHEKIHVEQFKEYGAIFVQNNRQRFETEAYEKEDQFIKDLIRKGLL